MKLLQLALKGRGVRENDSSYNTGTELLVFGGFRTSVGR